MIKYILLLTMLINVGCVLKSDPTVRKYEYLTASQLKFIQAGITDPRHEATFKQSSYLVNEDSHLLLRADDLKEKTKNTIIDDDKYFVMALQISVQNIGLTEAQIDSIKLCPLHQEWLLLATWEKAHPFKNGDWDLSGGSYNESECISVSSFSDQPDITVPVKEERDTYPRWDFEETSEEASEESNPSQFNKIQFNITNWFKNNVEGANNNFGFVLISAEPLHVWGDESSHSPFVKWSQPVNY